MLTGRDEADCGAHKRSSYLVRLTDREGADCRLGRGPALLFVVEIDGALLPPALEWDAAHLRDAAHTREERGEAAMR